MRPIPTDRRGADVADESVKPIAEVAFDAFGRKLVALIFDPVEDGARDVVVFELLANGQWFACLGAGVLGKRFRAVAMPKNIARQTEKALRDLT